MDKINEGVRAIQIQKEITRIKDKVSDKDFDNAILIKKWYKLNTIEKFYAEVKQSYFLNHQLNIDTLRIYNNECFDLAVNALQKVDWEQFAANLRKARILWIILVMVIGGVATFGLNMFFNYLTNS